MRMQALFAELQDGSFSPVAMPDVAIERQLEMHRAARVAGGVMQIGGKDTPVVALLKMGVESVTRFSKNGLTPKETEALNRAQAMQAKFAAEEKARAAAAQKKPAQPLPTAKA